MEKIYSSTKVRKMFQSPRSNILYGRISKEGSQSTAFLYSNEIHRIPFYNKRIAFRVPETFNFKIDV